MRANEQPVWKWARESACVHLLRDARVVRVCGDDARTWLNGQTTSDVGQATPQDAVYTLSVNVKGRVQADLWVSSDAEGMAFVAPASAVDSLLEHMERYIIMEDVELCPAADLHILSVQGPLSEALLEATSVACERRVTTARLGAGGVDLWLTSEQLEPARTALSTAAQQRGGGESDQASWAAAHVAAGLPRFGVDFGPESYPQEAGLKERAVSFEKGCYLGQEVICMLENRGKLSRRLCVLEGPAGAGVQPGEPCLNASDSRVGQVTSWQPFSPPRALAYLKADHHELGQNVRINEGTWTVVGVVGEES